MINSPCSIRRTPRVPYGWRRLSVGEPGLKIRRSPLGHVHRDVGVAEDHQVGGRESPPQPSHRPVRGPLSWIIPTAQPARSSSSVSGAPQAATSGPSLLPSTTRTGAKPRQLVQHVGGADVAGVQDHVRPVEVGGHGRRAAFPEARRVGVGDHHDAHATILPGGNGGAPRRCCHRRWLHEGTDTRRWLPKRVLITAPAAEQPHTAEIVRRCEAAGVTDIEILPGNRLTGLTGANERETYARAKSTLAVVVAPPSALKPQPIPPSADWRIDLARGCPGPLPVLLPGRFAERPAGHPGLRQSRRRPGRHRHPRRPRARSPVRRVARGSRGHDLRAVLLHRPARARAPHRLAGRRDRPGRGG